MEMETSSPAKRSSKRVRLLQDPSLPACPDLFDRLATEIIEKIFVSACPYVEFPGVQSLRGKGCSPISPETMDPTILSMVCRRWRDITTTYHFLWANIVIDPSEISLEEWYERDFGLLLRDYLTRSGALPLQIRIKDHEGLDRISMLSIILHLVGLHCERWQSIAFDFSFSQELLPIFDGLEGPLPLLEHLQIRTDSLDDSKLKQTLFLSAPSLRHLILRASILRPVFQIPWRKLSEAMFHGIVFVPHDFGEVMTSLATSVMTLAFSNCETSSSWVSATKKSVTLPKLRGLYCWDSCEGILARLICPFLERLEIEDGTEGEITEFLKISSCSLTHIHLGHIRADGCFYWDVDSTADFEILKTSSLSTLKSLSLAGLTDPVLNLLDLDAFHLFPSLETLHADANSESSDGSNVLSFMDSRIERLRDIVESRTRARPTAHHHSHLPWYPHPHPHPHGPSIGTHSHIAHSHHIAPSHHIAHPHHVAHPHHIAPLYHIAPSYHIAHPHQTVHLHPRRDDYERSSLKNCHFGFQVRDNWRTRGWYSALEQLRSFCLSHHVTVDLDTFTARPSRGKWYM